MVKVGNIMFPLKQAELTQEQFVAKFLAKVEAHEKLKDKAPDNYKVLLKRNKTQRTDWLKTAYKLICEQAKAQK